MNLGKILAAELQHEAATARKMLERLPGDKFGWKPHDKSMTLGRIAGHVVELLDWAGVTMLQDELDFATSGYKPAEYTSAAELVSALDKKLADAVGVLSNVADEAFGENWTLRNGEQVYFTMPKAAVMRSFVMNHIVHHRGQLSVYMRLLDIPVPSIYGPSADEGQM